MNNKGLGFGGLLLGIGLGWLIFHNIGFKTEYIAYLLILTGLGMTITGLLPDKKSRQPLQGIIGGLIGGFILAAFFTQGLGLVYEFTDTFPQTINPYSATDTINLKIPLKGDQVNINVNSVNGAINVHSWNGDSIRFDLTVTARGATSSEANSNLADFTYQLDENVTGETQEISLRFPISMDKWTKYIIKTDIYIPEEAKPVYDLTTVNGAITLIELSAEAINVKTTNGAVALTEITANLVNAETTNGAITASLTTSSSRLTTTNGGIRVTYSETGGKYSLQTVNGGIEVELPTGDEIGYVLNLDTGIGSIHVNLADIDYSVDKPRTKIGESHDYNEKPVLIELEARAAIGSIDIN